MYKVLSAAFVGLLAVLSADAFAEEYYWVANRAGAVKKPTPIEACRAASNNISASVPVSETRQNCHWDTGGVAFQVNRHTIHCSHTQGWSWEAEACVDTPPPDQCASTEGSIDHSVAFAGRRSDIPPGTPTRPVNSSMCSGGCQYAYAGDGTNTNCGSIRGGDPGDLYCVFRYSGTGQACVPSDEPVDAAAPPDPNPPADPNDPTNPANNCGKGFAWSGTTCVRYFEPDTNNGGNTGGNDNSGGNTGGNNGGSDNGGGDSGSGNGSGDGSGNGSGDGNGSGNGNTGGGGPATDVSGVEDRLDKIWDSLFGGEYDNSGDGNDAESEASGESAGSAIGDLLASEGQEAVDAYEEDSKEFLDTLPNTVAGWFGDGTTVGLRRGLETVLPSASGCADYKVAFSLGKYNSSLVLPVCEISRYTRLLEWVIYCVTAIGLWRILFSGLRQDDVKAAKGGF
ncbi:hypothetical protein [Ectopseudomonas alcaliphila]|uniref:hypothetical protein n=1 Tax=Ectopseudomonas alcaliphila TaxID=101564 RepID=UPI002782E85F|nr:MULTISPECIES: hypothetical protein [Pseudomonas]MDP9942131.1 hypothetical protein [Pseudomonas sp. 3400]MDR7014532.1 hypothetical protein [Pseudomonas alcaliphila]